jgi:DNA-binding transcriptional LysR family regulator
MQEAMASIMGEVIGALRLVCTTTAGKYVLPRLLARFQEAHPQVETTCLVVPRAVAIGRLADGEAHIGLASVLESVRGLEYRPFMTDRIGLIAPVDHPWATRSAPVLPEELPTERYISREDTSGTAVAVREALAWHDLAPEDLPLSMTLGNSEAIRMAVQEGLGLAFVSTLVASEAVEAGNLAIVPVEGMEITTTLYMIRNPEVAGTAASNAFWDFAFGEEHADLRSRADPAGTT